MNFIINSESALQPIKTKALQFTIHLRSKIHH